LTALWQGLILIKLMGKFITSGTALLVISSAVLAVFSAYNHDWFNAYFNMGLMYTLINNNVSGKRWAALHHLSPFKSIFDNFYLICAFPYHMYRGTLSKKADAYYQQMIDQRMHEELEKLKAELEADIDELFNTKDDKNDD
jgi:hypothetical protein